MSEERDPIKEALIRKARQLEAREIAASPRETGQPVVSEAPDREQLIRQARAYENRSRFKAEYEKQRAIEADSTAGMKAKATARGAIRGLGSVATLPFAAVEGMSALGDAVLPDVLREPAPAAGSFPLTEAMSETTGKAVNALGLSDDRPREDIPVAEKAAEFFGEALASGAPISGAVYKYGKNAVPSATKRLSETARKMALSPGGMVAGEVLSAAGESAGRVAAEQMSPDSGALDWVLGMAGGVAPGMMTGTARRIGEKALNVASVLDVGQARGPTGSAIRTTEDVLDERVLNRERALEKFAEGEEINERLGTDFSGSEMAQDDNFRKIEQRLAFEDSKFQHKLREKSKKSVKAIFDSLHTRLAPDGNPEVTRAFLNEQRDVLSAELQVDIDAAAAAVRERVLSATDGMLAEDSSSEVIELVRNGAKEAMNKISHGDAATGYIGYDQVHALARLAGRSATAPRARLVDQVFFDKASTGVIPKKHRLMPDQLYDDIVRITTEERMIPGPDGIPVAVTVKIDPTISDVFDLQKEVSATIREIKASNFADRRLPFLTDLRSAVKDTINEFIEKSPHSDIARHHKRLDAEWAVANRRWRGRVTRDIIRREESATLEQATLDAYFSSGKRGKNRMRQFLMAAGGRPDRVSADVDVPQIGSGQGTAVARLGDAGTQTAVGSGPSADAIPGVRKLMRNYIIGAAYDFSSNADGTINAAKLERFKKLYRPALREFPESIEEIDNVMRLQRTMDDAVGRQTRSLREIEDAQFKAISGGSRAAVRQVLEAGSPADQVKEATKLVNRLSGNPEALAGARRMFWDEIASKVTVEKGDAVNETLSIVSDIKLGSVLRKNKEALTVLFGREHVANLELIHKASQRANMKGGANSPGRGNTLHADESRWSKVTEGTYWRALYSKFYGALVRISIVNRALNKAFDNVNALQALDLMTEALSNPPLLKTLLMNVDERTAPIVARRLRANLYSLGHRVNMDDEKQSPATSPQTQSSTQGAIAQ